MRWGVGLAFTLVWFAAGCDMPTVPDSPRTGVPVTPPGTGGGGNVTALLARDCRWCHTTEHPSAGINFEYGSLTRAQLNDMGRGVQLEMAPFIHRLPAADKRALLDWVRAQGGTVPEVQIPSRFTWRLADAIANVPNGARAPGFGFVIEDGFIDELAWKVENSTDSHGRAYRAVTLNQDHGVDQ